jgi:hypothetical protein
MDLPHKTKEDIMSTLLSISPEGSSLNSLGRRASTLQELIQLAADGKVAVEDGRVVLTTKGQRLQKKSRKAQDLETHKEIVLKALANVPKDTRGLTLTKPLHFRAAVEASKVDVAVITRTNVLDALRELRDEGKVESVRTSRSNFGVRWKVAAA